MKRLIESDEGSEKRSKKIKTEAETTSAEITEGRPAEEMTEATSFVLTDENLLHEVLKRADARSLATASCVNRQWHRTAKDERLWELICTRHWANAGCGGQQLRSVVLALGGFRRLHSLYLWQLSKPSTSNSNSNSAWPCLPAAAVPAKAGGGGSPWGKDEVHLSLSLLSIRYYEKMNFSNRGKGL
ncbi:hypothetical protein RHSIM_Rhsim07G0223800 [Rhododendron simsii]|uniref:F-box protein GID2 n=1 Tax=Rhododendron simsii TaxID=118357 RepID=A0A834GMK2_RHOSS|nr:hypothetical protein RHSIM_Rhsim07G0223800 [Rhododendron simsii]